MSLIDVYESIGDLFQHKIVVDERGNEFVLYLKSPLNVVKNIEDKTQFEATENHVHLMDNVRLDDIGRLRSFIDALGNALLYKLRLHFPDKEFRVYITLKERDSMIIRFHQNWEDEAPYYSGEYPDDELLFCFL